MLRYKTNLAPFLNIEPLQIHLSTKILRDFHTDNRFTHGSIPYKDLSWSNQANIGYFYKINLPKKNNCSSLYYINEWFVYIPAYSLIYPLENKKSGCSRRKNSGVPRQAIRLGTPIIKIQQCVLEPFPSPVSFRLSLHHTKTKQRLPTESESFSKCT